MARKVIKPRLHESGSVITTKTPFGSTSDMIIDVNQYTENGQAISIMENEVICKDDKGFYKTLKSRIDTGFADPNRYANENNRLHLQATTS